jgi:hypothetical protein
MASVGESGQAPFNQNEYIDNAIRKVKQKKPLPEIDFTLHTMEDGTQVSTLERVCKGAHKISSAASGNMSPCVRWPF